MATIRRNMGPFDGWPETLVVLQRYDAIGFAAGLAEGERTPKDGYAAPGAAALLLS